MTNILRFFVFVCIALNGLFGVDAAQAELPSVGSQIMNNLSIKTDYKPYNLSLPPGPWIVAFTKTTDAQAFLNDGLTIGAGPAFKVFGEVGLVQVSDKIITGLILVKARLKTSAYVHNPPVCNDQNFASHVNSYGVSGPLIIKCLEVKPFNWSSAAQSDSIQVLKDFLNKLDINYPTDMLGLQFYEDDRRGRFLDFSYFVNPTVWGYPNTGSSVDRSPWGKSMILRDPAKATLMQALTAYAESYASVLSNSAREGGSGAGFVAFTPPPNSLGTASSALPNQGADSRIKKISETCMSIGFKPNTPAMTNCIKELSSRN